MPRYFMRDTPLQAMEQLMMSQPGQKPRGGGMYRSPFHYTPKDVACEYCQNYVRKHPCRLCECTCMEERIEAGVLELNAFVRDCFAPSSMGPQLRKRMHTQLPDEVDVLLDMEQESLADLNALAQAADALSSDDMKKLGAVVTLAKPQNAEQVKNLVENLDLFDFAPGAHSPAEYGKYMIQRSGHFDYDENLDEFYDYEGYALQRMNEEDGMFTDRGYIAYKGYTSLAEIMDGSQSSHMEMGGMA